VRGPSTHRAALAAVALVVLFAGASIAGAAEADGLASDYWTRALPWHPKVVHVAIALAIIVPGLAAIVWLGTWRGWLPALSWRVPLLLQGGAVAACLVALRTGEHDAELVAGYAAAEAIAAHAAFAHTMTYLAVLNLGLLAATVALQRWPRRQIIAGALAVLGLAGESYAGYRAGDAGGRLVYVANAADAHK
jgi:hypothetical protein